MADFSKGIAKDRNNIYKMLKDKQLKQNSIFPPKSFNNESKIKLFLERLKLYLKKTHTIKNKGSSSQWRKIILDESVGSQKGIKALERVNMYTNKIILVTVIVM